MKKVLDNKVILVTGSGSGIGKATALKLGLEGASVAICGRSPQRLQRTAQEFEDRGISVQAEVCDVCNAEEVEGFVGPQKNEEEADGEPLGPQCFGPMGAGRKQLFGQAPGEHEGACHAEEVARDQESEGDESPPVDPRKDPGQVLRSKLRTPQPVGDDQHRCREEEGLQ